MSILVHERKSAVATLAIAGFVAGALAVVVFHQGFLALLREVLDLSVRPWSPTPVPPFGVPQIVSIAFWGGVWGVLLALASRRVASPGALLVFGFVFGALLPSLVAWFVVAPLKGQPMMAGGDPARLLTALGVNGAWGFGTALLLLPVLRGRTRAAAREA